MKPRILFLAAALTLAALPARAQNWECNPNEPVCFDNVMVQVVPYVPRVLKYEVRGEPDPNTATRPVTEIEVPLLAPHMKLIGNTKGAMFWKWPFWDYGLAWREINGVDHFIPGSTYNPPHFRAWGGEEGFFQTVRVVDLMTVRDTLSGGESVLLNFWVWDEYEANSGRSPNKEYVIRGADLMDWMAEKAAVIVDGRMLRLQDAVRGHVKHTSFAGIEGRHRFYGEQGVEACGINHWELNYWFCWPGAKGVLDAPDGHFLDSVENVHVMLLIGDFDPPPSPVSAESDEFPGSVRLAQNYPNPFNPATSITYELASLGPVRLEVFDATGRSVAVFADGVEPSGRHSVRFDASGLPSGLYVYRLQAGGAALTRKMTLIR